MDGKMYKDDILDEEELLALGISPGNIKGVKRERKRNKRPMQKHNRSVITIQKNLAFRREQEDKEKEKEDENYTG